MAKKTQNKPPEVIPVNPKAKDTFFKKVYEKEERYNVPYKVDTAS